MANEMIAKIVLKSTKFSMAAMIVDVTDKISFLFLCAFASLLTNLCFQLVQRTGIVANQIDKSRNRRLRRNVLSVPQDFLRHCSLKFVARVSRRINESLGLLLTIQIAFAIHAIQGGQNRGVGNLALLPQPLLHLDYSLADLAQRTSITADSRSPSTWFAPRAPGRKPRKAILGLIRCINHFCWTKREFGEYEWGLKPQSIVGGDGKFSRGMTCGSIAKGLSAPGVTTAH